MKLNCRKKPIQDDVRLTVNRDGNWSIAEENTLKPTTEYFLRGFACALGVVIFLLLILR